MESNRKFYDSPIMRLWAILTIAVAIFIIFLSSVNVISLHTSNLALPIFLAVAFLVGALIWSFEGKKTLQTKTKSKLS